MAQWITPTAIKGLLSTEDQCQWSAWYRAHNYRYPKIESDFDFKAWREQHNDLVGEVRLEMEADGYACSIEKANTFKVEGAAATIKGVVDVIGERTEGELVRIKIVDAKTGRRWQKDEWQVRVYMACFPLFAPLLDVTKTIIVGAVRYLQGKNRDIEVRCPQEDQERIWNQVKLSAGEFEPARTPSTQECSFCDILKCPDRETEKELSGSSGGKF
jgi:hypothetical protein